ncbi:hypothetical protein SAMN02927916_3153 [Flavobacterium anhuiense]|uniref:Uncharacterized protein n=1 Tax=Flavobacterium anhuiense TaxID=459526 RepID=A0ABY0LWU0_9FLAO|nr:hypothetical protein [Flavobacterium anhuiense]SCY74556.1 hypothetical protein SAMN02927916_3153 [Flavobacterium anhuiense]
MKVTDINGFSIEVNDLKEAIITAKRFTEYKHEDKSFSEFDKRQKIYWMDMYEKLTAIKEQVTTH